MSMKNNLTEYFSELVDVPPPEPKSKGRPKIAEAPLDGAATSRRRRQKKRVRRLENIAILDFETDPFDADREVHIEPFLAVLYADAFAPIIIWDDDYATFTKRVFETIEVLAGEYIIYAHNGGKFDFLFMVSKYRGKVSFKGRGIMSARIGKHEIRDSFHIIPERLANWQKDSFDYDKLLRHNRQTYREDIIRYCVNDCKYLLEIVRSFCDEFGFKISIGQAAMGKLKESYDVDSFSKQWDSYIRQFYFGGRVECIRGRGDFRGDFHLYDTNSMYPYVMSSCAHPIGGFVNYQVRGGLPNDDTVFMDIECVNRGALIKRNADNETTARESGGRFLTTIWEYTVAIKYGLISNVRVNYCIDCSKRSDFSLFVNPAYDKRQIVKTELGKLKALGQENSAAWNGLKKDDIFLKLLLNNAYGKFGQDPSKYKEYCYTNPGEEPDAEWRASIDKLPADIRDEYRSPHFECDSFWIWYRPNPSFRYNNVGVAASITGAARAVLLEALQGAVDPIYCDTDSIICRDLVGVPLDAAALGAWDLEDEFSRVIITGKKMYATWHKQPKKRSQAQIAIGLDPRYTVKSKGSSRLTWTEMEAMLQGETITKRNLAPTLDRYGRQYYLTRRLRATAK